jgi:hypothetical protein
VLQYTREVCAETLHSLQHECVFVYKNFGIFVGRRNYNMQLPHMRNDVDLEKISFVVDIVVVLVENSAKKILLCAFRMEQTDNLCPMCVQECDRCCSMT